MEAKSAVLTWIDSHSTKVGQSSGYSYQHTHVEHSLRPFPHESFPKDAVFTSFGVKYSTLRPCSNDLANTVFLENHFESNTTACRHSTI